MDYTCIMQEGDTMNLMLNYTLMYGSPLSELLTAKLTCFYNKVILQYATRLTLLMPEGNSLSRAELHKQMFDEIVVTKFDPTNTQYWNTKNLHRFLHFTHSTLNVQYNHVFIDEGRIFKSLEIPSEANLVACNTRSDDDLIRYVNKQLSSHCDLPLLDSDNLVFYDFSAYFIADDLRATIQKFLKQIVVSYPEYVDDKCSYAIMSCIVAHAIQQKKFEVTNLNIEPLSIVSSGLVEDFYTLI